MEDKGGEDANAATSYADGDNNIGPSWQLTLAVPPPPRK